MTLGEKVNGFVGWIADSLTGGSGYGDSDPFVFEDEEEGYEVDRNTVRKPVIDYSQRASRSNDTNVAKLPGYKGHEVRIVEPRSFGDTTQIVQQLLDQKTVILNLHLLDKETAQKTIDFVCGATFAIGGKPQKIGDTVFVFTPNSVQLSVEAKEATSFGTDGLWGASL